MYVSKLLSEKEVSLLEKAIAEIEIREEHLKYDESFSYDDFIAIFSEIRNYCMSEIKFYLPGQYLAFLSYCKDYVKSGKVAGHMLEGSEHKEYKLQLLA